MAFEPDEILQICRFCLCQDEAFLIPLEDILDFSPNIQDVALLTGIQINEATIALHTICLDCTTKLKSSITFRNSCLSNESLFQQLSAMLKASVKESCALTAETIELLSDDSMDLDLLSVDSSFDKPNCSQQSNDEDSCTTALLQGSEESWDVDNTAADVFSYSANYIEPGEILFTDPEEHSQYIEWDTSLNPKAPPTVIWRREPGKRKLHLCDICGRMVLHISTHAPVHKEEPTYSCSQCDMKTKQKTNLQQHIKQVHMKIASKKCAVCDKRFIHHKTYRYHMLTHEGKTFECQDCSKTFSNSIYLRDHINRLHNAGMQIRTKLPGERTRRKRNRSRSGVDDNATSD